MKEIHQETKQSYGSRRMAKQLQQEGHLVGRYKARSLMRRAGIMVRRKKRFKVTTDSRHGYPIAPNLLDRRFDVDGPNQVWASDITYMPTKEGWLFLAVVLDLYSRKVVGWSMATRMSQELVVKALRMAIKNRQPDPGLIHHSDRGSQYASHTYQRLLATHELIPSMSRKGDCLDNAVVERFFGTLKRERTYLQSYTTRQQAKLDIFTYIETFYNRKRLHSYLGYLSPDRFEMDMVPLNYVSVFT
jgi:transposase InsO family protein